MFTKKHLGSLKSNLKALSVFQNWWAGPLPDQSSSKWNRLFQRVFAKLNILLCAYYLGFDWSGWIGLFKNEILITSGMVWLVWQMESTLNSYPCSSIDLPCTLVVVKHLEIITKVPLVLLMQYVSSVSDFNENCIFLL